MNDAAVRHATVIVGRDAQGGVKLMAGIGIAPDWILLANAYAPLGCVMMRVKAERRGRAAGTSSIQAARRPRLIAAAVNRRCRCVLAKPR